MKKKAVSCCQEKAFSPFLVFSAASLHTGPVHGQPCGHPRSRPARKASADEKGTPKKDNDRKKENLFPTTPSLFFSAQPQEPILIPKVQIYFADFPDPHYFIDQRLFTLETCCGYWYGQARKWSCVARFSRMRRLSIALCVASIFKGRRKRTGRLKVRGALPAVQPRLRPTRFRGRPKAPQDAFRLCDGRQKEKRTLPGAFADVSRLVCVATCPTSCEVVVVSSSWSRNFDLVPFRSGEILEKRKTFSPILIVWRNRSYPTSQDRLTHVQMLFTWNPSPLQSSKISFEYLLLPPRSAPAADPAELTFKPSTPPPRPSYSSRHGARGASIVLTVEYRYVAPAPSIFRAS